MKTVLGYSLPNDIDKDAIRALTLLDSELNGSQCVALFTLLQSVIECAYKEGIDSGNNLSKVIKTE